MIYMRSYIWDSAYPFSLTTRPMNVRHQVRTKELRTSGGREASTMLILTFCTAQHYYHVGKFRKP
ncbi:hypothetical protein OOU_Y34scaffold01079g2 [Pyricularia oryzae Y34]|uniref:Uncharacterized protein n=1 Tax=Pyricularia oryzae (strain Y34) TaxID=1143189 RepID=A0AA97PFG8_PYRO3|nr:hypothetical protein OOU_Y34scaffold01079g2 [Pyricularia oryzae Y34]